MHGSFLSICVASMAILAVNATSLNDGPDYGLILSRQAPGTPQYDCHLNCGNALAGGRIEGHCKNSTWTEYYEKCLDCALEYNIWSIYGNGVTAAAKSCGLTPTPSPSGDDDSSTPSSTAVVSPSETTAAPGSSETTAAPGSSETTAAPESSETTAATTPPVSAGPSTNGTTTSVTWPSDTNIPESGAGALMSELHTVGALLSVGVLAVALGTLMGE